MTTYHQLRTAKQLADILRAEFPDALDEDLAAAIDGEMNVSEAIAAVIRMSDETSAYENALRQRINEMEVRKDRLSQKVDKLREIARAAMESCGIRKIEREDFTASLVASRPKVIVTDMEKIPHDYLVPQAPKPSLVRIGEDLKAGKTVPGATLGNPGTHLTIRRS